MQSRIPPWTIAGFFFTIPLFAASPFPTTEVKLRTEEREAQLTQNELKVMGVIPNYALLRPKPFHYSTDVANQRNSKGAEATPFVIAGMNCDSWIEKASSITGVSLDSLTQRGRPGNQTPDTDPAWNGANNKNIRSSFDGFLKDSQSIKDVLVKDNETVRAAGLTHQAIIDPIFTAIEQMMEMVAQNKDWDPDAGFEMNYRGEKYDVIEGTLGLIYFAGLKYDEDMKKVKDEALPGVRVNARSKAKSYRIGWTGAGVQGSPFGDEIYSSCNLTFTRSDGKKLTIDCLTPNLIYRYGFYQGGPYRQDPSNLIGFFKLKPDPKIQSTWKTTCRE